MRKNVSLLAFSAGETLHITLINSARIQQTCIEFNSKKRGEEEGDVLLLLL
jgi:hypothetical protein